MKVDVLVDFGQFWSRLNADIQSARQSVFVQTFAFEGDAIGKLLADGLLHCPAPDKRVLADSFTRVVLSDRFRYSPVNVLDRALHREARETARMFGSLQDAGVPVRFTNPYGLSPRKILSRNHKKLIVVDERVAYLGGMNFSEHNAAWHDMMLRLEDEAAATFLGEDFLATWNGRDRVATARFDGNEIHTLDGRSNREVFEQVLGLIDSARESIFVQSPYITFPFYERLRSAARRGVRVTILTPGQNNWNYFAEYARLESALSEIDLRFYKGRMSHLKAMLIDGEHLIAGSSNLDYLSYRIYQEIVAIVRHPEVISAFRERVMIPDLANAERVDCKAGKASKHWLSLQMKLLDAAVTIFT